MVTLEPIREQEAEQACREFFQPKFLLHQPDKPGRWQGEGAKALGLQDPVRWPVLKRLLQARHPLTNRDWWAPIQPPGRDREAAWLLTFRIPTEMNVLWHSRSQGKKLGYEFAHAFAVESALQRFKEGLAPHSTGRDDLDKRWPIFATFQSATTSDLKPRLQTRALFLNLGLMGCGMVAPFPKDIILSQKERVEQHYRAMLRQGLRREMGTVETTYCLDKQWATRPDQACSRKVLNEIMTAQMRRPGTVERWWTQCQSTVEQGLRRAAQARESLQRILARAGPAQSQPGPAPGQKKDFSHPH